MVIENIKIHLVIAFLVFSISCFGLYNFNETKDWSNTEYFFKIIFPSVILSGVSLFGIQLYFTSSKNQLLNTSFKQTDVSISDPTLVSP